MYLNLQLSHRFSNYNSHTNTNLLLVFVYIHIGVRCCCGWYTGGSQPVTQGRIANRCDYRRLVTSTENLANCRDANEGHGLGCKLGSFLRCFLFISVYINLRSSLPLQSKVSVLLDATSSTSLRLVTQSLKMIVSAGRFSVLAILIAPFLCPHRIQL